MTNVIIAPPPTPNGDLHVGHLSGPYFGVDIYRRYLQLKGEPVVAALSVDLNQTYVVTTAQRLGDDPAKLAQQSHQQVQETLAMADIRFDTVGMPDAAYSAEISQWFAGLYGAGVLEKRTRLCPYDVRQDRFMFESYASGRCPVCLSGTNGNICEACGHPNEAQDLLGLHPTNGSVDDPIEERPIDEFCLDLEPLRDRLWSYLDQEVGEKRPSLQRLLAELFSRRLPKFPVTFPSDWGIPAPFPGADGLCINVWAEMVPGHYHWINKAAASQGLGPLVVPGATHTYTQYLGFDNSFFYVIAQLALAMVARDAGLATLLPTAFITNEFYQLDNFKFSTSQGHLIWGRDLIAQIPADEARFYFAWSNPEYNQANFTNEDMEKVLAKKFRGPFDQVLAGLGALNMPVFAQPCDYSRSILSRFDDAYCRDRQSLRIAALTVANGLDILKEHLEQGGDPGQIAAIAQAVAAGLAPISPNYAEQLWRASGATSGLSWPEEPAVKAAE